MNTRGLKLIGKGLFSKVYQLDSKRVFIQSVCNVKECLSMDWHQSTGVFPILETVDRGEYICEYFERVTSLKEALSPDHYEIYRELRKLDVGYVKNTYDLAIEWRNQFKTVKNKKYRDALIDMLETLQNWGTDIKFEISPRNVAVKNGKLILLDVFFFHSQMLEIRNSKPNYSYR